MTPNFTFTRVPSTKVSVDISVSGLVAADDLLVVIGRRGATGGTATSLAQNLIANFGDPVAVATECDGLFGTGAEISEMIVAAVKGNYYGGQAEKKFPKIIAIAMANASRQYGPRGMLGGERQPPDALRRHSIPAH